jgi:cytochrome oxidase Cu insertion factor (SCO1/SenC/PrrC family)
LNVRNEIDTGAKMRLGAAILFFLGLLAVPSGQENPGTNHAIVLSVGLEIGQQAPAFTLPDQFGHEQSNETLKGSKGTVLLFFRSADW